MKDKPITFAELQKFISENLPKQKRCALNCGGNLFLELLPSGTAFFYTRMRIEGKDSRKKIGHYPDISLKEAREQAKSIINEVNNNKEKEFSDIPTFKDYAQIWLSFFLPNAALENSHKNNKRYQTVKSYVNALEGLHLVPLDKITPFVVDKVLSKSNKTQGTKYRAIRALNQCLNSAVVDGIIKENFCKNMLNAHGLLSKKYGKPKCKGYPWVPADQLKADYFDKLQNTSLNRRVFFLFHAFTFVRSGAVTVIEWEWIDFEHKVINIPGHFMKMGKDFTIPITRFVETLLINWKKECKKIDQEESKYVFHSSGSIAKPIRLATLQDAVRSVTDKDVSMHGIRKTARTWMASIGVPEIISEISLSHSPKSQLVNIYNKYDYFKERMAVLTLWDYFIYTQLPDNFKNLLGTMDRDFLARCKTDLEEQKKKVSFFDVNV